MHIATDGESYGHHHSFGDMALAYVLHKLSQDKDIKLTNYGEFLEKHPPEWEVEIHEKSSWSYAHGNRAMELRLRLQDARRLQSSGAARPLHQGVRPAQGPARPPLRHPRSASASALGRARQLHRRVVHDRSQRSVRHFLRKFGHPDLDDSQVRDALWLLEIQRDAMLMYTSCGWFFDELSGLETTQCLHYARGRSTW